MRKINYPKDKKDIKLFHEQYYLSLDKTNETKISKELKNAPLFKGKRLDFKSLILLPFEDLIDLTNHFQSFISTYDYKVTVGKKRITKNKFVDLFNYSVSQPSIASFFMQAESLKLKTCCYCGIDYINSFKDIADYSDKIHFLNFASIEELQLINGIGPVKANSIISFRKKNKIVKCDDITKSQSILDELKAFDFKNSHNHFTLDHILPQKEFKYLSLCLYNLVPSCYSCNSKFKKAKEFVVNNDLPRISPTSTNYSLTNDFSFKVLYNGNIKNIKNVEDFILTKKVTRNRVQINHYSSIFKLDGRYCFHKQELLELFEKKSKYSKRLIQNIASNMAESQRVVKEMIYGKELFVEELDSPLHKLKRDVAKNLKIIK